MNREKGKETWNKGRTYTQANPAKERPEIRGENNGQWKGGKTKLGRRIRNLPKYARWRTSVFERDDYTCQECGRRSQKGDKVILHAHHHEDSFASLLDKHSIISLGDAHECDVLWRKEIAITLCRKCHRNTETYGANHG